MISAKARRRKGRKAGMNVQYVYSFRFARRRDNLAAVPIAATPCPMFLRVLGVFAPLRWIFMPKDKHTCVES